MEAGKQKRKGPEPQYLLQDQWPNLLPLVPGPPRFCPTVPQVRGHLMSFRGRLGFKNVKYQFSLFILFTVPVSPFSSSFQYSQLIFAVLGIDPWPFNMVGKHYSLLILSHLLSTHNVFCTFKMYAALSRFRIIFLLSRQKRESQGGVICPQLLSVQPRTNY